MFIKPITEKPLHHTHDPFIDGSRILIWVAPSPLSNTDPDDVILASCQNSDHQTKIVRLSGHVYGHVTLGLFIDAGQSVCLSDSCI